MEKKMARVRYEKSTDRYVVELYDHKYKSWELEVSYKCVASAIEPDGETNFIHYELVNEIFKLMGLGYTVTQCKGEM